MGQPVFVSGQKMGSGRVRNTTKNVSFSCVFLSGVYKNVAIEWLWVRLAKTQLHQLRLPNAAQRLAL